MLSSCDVIGFVSTIDASRARRFYADTLGLTLVSEDEFATVFRVHGTMLRVTSVEEFERANFTVLGWSVADIEAEIRELGERGVDFERFDALEQDELGVWNSPGGARVAWFKDPDGNILSLAQL